MSAVKCPACECGLLVPVEYDDWRGPQVCSFCGGGSRGVDTERAGCLVCKRWFPNVEAWLDHRPSCFLGSYDPYAPTVVEDDSESPATTTQVPVEKAFGGRKLAVGGVCKKGLHRLTTRNLYLSPAGVATCKDCRKERLRKKAA